MRIIEPIWVAINAIGGIVFLVAAVNLYQQPSLVELWLQPKQLFIGMFLSATAASCLITVAGYRRRRTS